MVIVPRLQSVEDGRSNEEVSEGTHHEGEGPHILPPHGERRKFLPPFGWGATELIV